MPLCGRRVEGGSVGGTLGVVRMRTRPAHLPLAPWPDAAFSCSSAVIHCCFGEEWILERGGLDYLDFDVESCSGNLATSRSTCNRRT